MLAGMLGESGRPRHKDQAAKIYIKHLGSVCVPMHNEVLVSKEKEILIEAQNKRNPFTRTKSNNHPLYTLVYTFFHLTKFGRKKISTEPGQ